MDRVDCPRARISISVHTTIGYFLDFHRSSMDWGARLGLHHRKIGLTNPSQAQPLIVAARTDDESVPRAIVSTYDRKRR